jgi:hypothetical protein
MAKVGVMRILPSRFVLFSSLALCTLCTSGVATAQLPEVITRGVVRPPTSVEVFHGTRKIEPKPVDFKPTTDAISTLSRHVSSASAEAWDSSHRYFAKLIERNSPKWDSFRSPVVVTVSVPPTIIQQVPVRTEGTIQPTSFAGATTSSATPGYLPWVNASRDVTPQPNAESAKQTVIVIRQAAPETNPGKLSPEMVLVAVGCFLVSMSCVIVALLVALRVRSTNPAIVPKESRSVVRDGHLAVAGWDAGPMPESAQKFDIGPSYADQLADQKRVEHENENAMIQHILDQNLLLHAELSGK